MYCDCKLLVQKCRGNFWPNKWKKYYLFLHYHFLTPFDFNFLNYYSPTHTCFGSGSSDRWCTPNSSAYLIFTCGEATQIIKSSFSSFPSCKCKNSQASGKVRSQMAMWVVGCKNSQASGNVGSPQDRDGSCPVRPSARWVMNPKIGSIGSQRQRERERERERGERGGERGREREREKERGEERGRRCLYTRRRSKGDFCGGISCSVAQNTKTDY